MSRQKQKRFEELKERENVLEDYKALYTQLRGNWNKLYFKNEQPITIEMGCGRGEYTTGLARVYPNRNFVGVDVKGDRLWVGSTQAIEENLTNVAFLRAQIQSIESFFAPNEVETIWITFPDPFRRDGDAKRRLTSPRYLEYYKELLTENGQVFFKTDNTPLFDYTLELLSERNDIIDLEYTRNLYDSEYMNDHYGIKTKFEEKFYDLGENIKYMKFRFDHGK
ncbi:tRNA (guanosine(46)-N7)-methyltransferase TrmB [Roseivirga echinicomitans]|uniref:tRNA (guanine-N(7)-)-methyltransferase n=1 Tax=Roseivirga echinicomitans TaxID=296218 RepID=A0A150X2D4_9BACT|nr:tRNA (guanosine(46)-N7)-methyltransferase TrmB [Roseivirga echinicomitans]KYG72874.1 tRNA (guanine-N7)-methyltransferase [Roseivirga echinicomitans]|tara:strand:- start:654 stop:1322 length:669 start_codon:yes stop_codon:yes gene_type:complete